MEWDLPNTLERAKRRFRERYGGAPRFLVAAPGRVNLIGEHIDYSDGFVLPMAIDRYCVLAADDIGAGRGAATIFSAAADEEVEIALDSPERYIVPGRWSNYFAGVIAAFGRHGMRPPGFVAVVESGVPLGGGLSSSAAIEVATATLLEALSGNALDLAEKALMCQWAEHEFAGVPCGIMDQFASAMCRADHLLLLDCRTQQLEHIPLRDPRITVLIVNTNVKHELSGGEYAERRGQCESAARKLGAKSLRDVAIGDLAANKSRLTEIEFGRARHAVTEITRTVEAASALKAGDWPTVGQLMYASHESLRDDYEVSCRELDVLVEMARSLGPGGGVIGSRMTGGGFGGCTVSLVETDKVAAVADSLAASYQAETGIRPSILTSRPARGAHVIQQ